jgi:hypothetical protein
MLRLGRISAMKTGEPLMASPKAWLEENFRRQAEQRMRKTLKCRNILL